MTVGKSMTDALKHEQDVEYWKAVAEARTRKLLHIVTSFKKLEREIFTALSEYKSEIGIHPDTCFLCGSSKEEEE